MTIAEEVRPCPCGKTPKKISVYMLTQGDKWGFATPDCCGEWMIEFRTNYAAQDSDECKQLAVSAWNDAPRALDLNQIKTKGKPHDVEQFYKDEPKEDVLPICECATVWPGQGHHPECPVRHKIESLSAQLSDAHAHAFNLLEPRTEDDMKDDLCEQIQLLHDRLQERAEQAEQDARRLNHLEAQE